MSFLLVVFGLFASRALAQDLLASPAELWSQQLFGAVGGNAKAFRGNGVFLTPDGSEVIAIANDGKVASYRAADGEPLWSDGPLEIDGFTVETFSGIAFSPASSNSTFMVYSMTYKDSEGGGNDYTVVVKRDMDGNQLSVSESLQGEQSGSPAVSNDGSYVFLTHNSVDKETGYFTVLNEDLGIVANRINDGGAFAPLGIYHSPEEGFYDVVDGIAANGTLNTNDMMMWTLMPKALNAPVPAGQIYGFQLPTDFDISAADSLEFFPLGASRAFQALTPPVITNKGRSVYWSASRSEYFCFIGNPGVDRARFNRGPNVKKQFAKDSPWGGQPILSTPAVSTAEDGSAVVFGGTASEQFFRFTHAFEGTEGDAAKVVNSPDPITVDTTTRVEAAPVIDPLARAVYYVERDGILHQANYDTIEDIWTEAIANGVQGEMALNSDGSILYLISAEGVILALEVGEGPTPAPVSPAPTASPVPPSPTFSEMPSVAPVASPPSAPTGETPTTGKPTAFEPGTTSLDDSTESSAFSKSLQLVALSVVGCFFW